MKENKLTEKELKSVSDSQNDLYKLTTDVDIVETQKQDLLHQITADNQK